MSLKLATLIRFDCGAKPSDGISGVLIVYDGFICPGLQLASGQAVGRIHKPSPFSAGTIALQAPHFSRAGLDLNREVPGYIPGTINIDVGVPLCVGNADWTLPDIDWTINECGEGRVAPETFSFVRCCLAFDDRYYTGLIYRPHPETKPANGEHRDNVLEVIVSHVPHATTGRKASIICRADAFDRAG